MVIIILVSNTKGLIGVLKVSKEVTLITPKTIAVLVEKVKINNKYVKIF